MTHRLFLGLSTPRSDFCSDLHGYFFLLTECEKVEELYKSSR